MKESRRQFLKQSLFATTALWIPQFLKASQPAFATDQERILVILQLSGGNDGLNTVIPYRNDIYYRSRPQLAIAREKVLPVSDALGLNPSLGKMRALMDKGYLSIVNNVGYPNPDRSHFRSMDIWQSASGSSEYINTGWIGRYLDSNCATCEPHSAIEIDDTLSLALRGQSVKGMAMRDAEKLYKAAHAPFLGSLQAPDPDAHDNVSYLYKTLSETTANTAYIYDRTKVYKSPVEYPQTAFGRQLKTIGTLIGSGISTRVYYAALSGFDTHVRQSGTQERLLSTYSDAVEALVSDLERTGNLDRTAILTFSEFGRRVNENASGGTDHGTANTLFLIGGKLRKPGFFNAGADLTMLDEGDLVYTIDFRSIYATLLKTWLGTDSQSILQGDFPHLDLV